MLSIYKLQIQLQKQPLRHISLHRAKKCKENSCDDERSGEKEGSKSPYWNGFIHSYREENWGVFKTCTAAACSGAVTAGTTQREGGCCKHYIHYSLDHTKGEPLPGLHPRKPLNCINKSVTEFSCNSLNSDLKKKFILRLHGYLRKRFGCSERGRDALWSRKQRGACREGRRNCLQLLKSSWGTNSFTVFTVMWTTPNSFSAYSTADDIFSHSLPFKLFP